MTSDLTKKPGGSRPQYRNVIAAVNKWNRKEEIRLFPSFSFSEGAEKCTDEEHLWDFAANGRQTPSLKVSSVCEMLADCARFSGQDLPYLATNDLQSLVCQGGVDMLKPWATAQRLIDITDIAHCAGMDCDFQSSGVFHGLELIDWLMKGGAILEPAQEWLFPPTERLDARFASGMLLTALSDCKIRRKWLVEATRSSRHLITANEVLSQGFQVNSDELAGTLIHEIRRPDYLGEPYPRIKALWTIDFAIGKFYPKRQSHYDSSMTCFGEAVEMVVASYPGLLQPSPGWDSVTIAGRDNLEAREALHRAGFRCTASVERGLVVLHPSDQSIQLVCEQAGMSPDDYSIVGPGL